jgi:hypothetical protein
MRSTATLVLLLVGIFAGPVRAQEAARNLEFIENRGQWDARARYAAHVAIGAQLFVEPSGLTYALVAGLPNHTPHHGGEAGATGPTDKLTGHSLRVEFVRPAAKAVLLAEDAAPDRHSFLRGNAPAKWAAEVRAFHQLRYRQLWPGTDLVLKENAAHQLEYDLLLAPRADPARVCATPGPMPCASTPPPATCWCKPPPACSPSSALRPGKPLPVAGASPWPAPSGCAVPKSGLKWENTTGGGRS